MQMRNQAKYLLFDSKLSKYHQNGNKISKVVQIKRYVWEIKL
jgi:hypothetical protein